jgi:hypothetical protein
MADFILLMHDDDDAWAAYLQRLEDSGCFAGGSAIGDGVCARKTGAAPDVTAHLAGYIRVTARDLDDARALLAGNPHFEAGGTVEIRELPRTG